MNGVSVFDALGSGSEDPAFWPKLDQAFGLLATYDPRTLDRVRRLTVGVVLWDHPRIHGSWNASSREIRLSPSTFRKEHAAHVAGTIVHEAAHAWLNSLGFDDRPEQRHRIEAICYRSEALFIRRVPGWIELADVYEGCALLALEDGPQAFSTEAKRDLDLLALADLGAPNWIVRLLKRRHPRGSA